MEMLEEIIAAPIFVQISTVALKSAINLLIAIEFSKFVRK